MLHNLFINSASTYLVPTTCRHCGSDKKVRVDAVSIQTHLINYDKCVTRDKIATGHRYQKRHKIL